MRELDHRNAPDCKVSPLADIYDYCRYYTKIPGIIIELMMELLTTGVVKIHIMLNKYAQNGGHYR